jgi:hypothetical protein
VQSEGQGKKVWKLWRLKRLLMVDDFSVGEIEGYWPEQSLV